MTLEEVFGLDREREPTLAGVRRRQANESGQLSLR